MGPLRHDQLGPGRHRALRPDDQAQDIIIEDVRRLGRICKRRALEFRDLLCVGRTHGIHAEPMTFGMKWATWAWALHRAGSAWSQLARTRARRVRSPAPWARTPTSTRSWRATSARSSVSRPTRVHAGHRRDRHAHVLAVLATVAATAESIATEMRALQKSDTLEVEEPFAKGQKGSSAMPPSENQSPPSGSAASRAW